MRAGQAGASSSSVDRMDIGDRQALNERLGPYGPRDPPCHLLFGSVRLDEPSMKKCLLPHLLTGYVDRDSHPRNRRNGRWSVEHGPPRGHFCGYISVGLKGPNPGRKTQVSHSIASAFKAHSLGPWNNPKPSSRGTQKTH